MATYKTKLSLGHYYKDVPDFLTCGFCAKEFLLENITLFIAHKFGCADYLKQASDIEDTSSPLTCSVCSRVFMTARGLLQHVQTDHNMRIYLQKGPLLISNENSCLPPPPAHSSFSKDEYTTTNTPATCHSESLDTCDFDQPTDLTLSVQKPSAKSPGDGDGGMKMDDDVFITETYSTSTTSLPKKRKFLFPKSPDEDPSPVVMCTNHNTEMAKEDARSSEIKHLFQVQNNSPTMKNEKEKNTKLKELLQKPQVSNYSLLSRDLSIEKFNTQFSVLELKKEPNDSIEMEATSTSTTEESLALESNKPVVDMSVKSRPIKSVSTLEQNIDQLIRSSVSSEYHDVMIATQTSGMIHSVSTSRFSQSDLSPRPQYRHHSLPQTPPDRIVSDYYEKTDYSDVGQMTKPKVETMHSTQGNACSQQLISHGKTLQMTSGQNHSFYRSHSHTFPTDRSPSHDATSESKVHSHILDPVTLAQRNHLTHRGHYFSDPTPQSSYQERLDEVGSREFSPCHQLEAPRQIPDDAFDKFQHKTGHRSFDSTPRMATYFDGRPLGRSRDDCDQLRPIDNKIVSSLTVGQYTPISRSHSESLEDSGHMTDQLTREDTEDHQMMDMKLMKKRRYPTSRPFKCIHCDQAFNQRIHLKKHMSKHTGVKPFKCQQCDYSTVERSHLKVHYRIHTGEKPYRCPYCDYATAQNSTLKIHLKRHHEGSTSITNNSHGVRDEDESYLNSKYNSGLGSNSEPRIPGRTSASLGQEYTGLFPDHGRPDFIPSDHSHLDSSVGHFSFFSKRKDISSYANSQLTIHQFNNHLPHLSPHLYEARSKMSPVEQPGMSSLGKSQQMEKSPGSDRRHLTMMPSPESTANERKCVSSENFPSITFAGEAGDHSKKDNSEVTSSNINISCQNTPGKDHRAQEVRYSPTKGKELASHIKDHLNVYDKESKTGNNYSAISNSDKGQCSSLQNMESMYAYQQLANNFKQPFDKEYTMKEKEKDTAINQETALDLKIHELKQESQSKYFVTNKSDHIINQKSVDDSDNEGDLDYNVGLPTVNIPNKEFVRG